METKNEIIKALEEMQNFFDQHNVRGWTKRTQLAIQRIDENKLNTKTILEDFVGAGMGSLTDLYISSDNGHLLKLSEDETNKQLETLAEQILIFKSGLDKR
jgi:hypothetical protein